MVDNEPDSSIKDSVISQKPSDKGCRDYEAMRKNIEKDIGLIKYDKTEDLKLYKYVIEKIEKEYDELNKENETILYGHDWDPIDPKDSIDKIKNVLNGENQVPDEKYKMSTKYLTHLIREMCTNLKEGSEKMKQSYSGLSRFNIIGREISYIHDEYISMNGILPKEFGERMEELYYDEKLVVGCHGTLKPLQKIIDNEFEDGLKCSYGPDIERVVYIGEGLTYKRFLRYVYMGTYPEENVIVVAIPKEDLENNKPIWKQNKEKEEGDNDETFLLNNRYIVGVYNVINNFHFNEDLKLIENKNVSSDDEQKGDKNITYFLDRSLQKAQV